MIILDTNVASEPTKISPNTNVLDWLDKQKPESLFLTAVSVAEMLVGVEMLPVGRRRSTLKGNIDLLLATLVNPILSFDREAAFRFAALHVRAKANLFTLPIGDGQIAAIADSHGFMVATRDVEPFLAAGVPVVNPWESGD